MRGYAPKEVPSRDAPKEVPSGDAPKVSIPLEGIVPLDNLPAYTADPGAISIILRQPLAVKRD